MKMKHDMNMTDQTLAMRIDCQVPEVMYALGPTLRDNTNANTVLNPFGIGVRIAGR